MRTDPGSTAALGYLPRVLSGKPRQPSLQFWTGAKVTPQTSPLGGLRKARLWTRSAPRPKRQKDELGATISAEGISLIKTRPKTPLSYCRNPVMGDTSFRVLSSPNRKKLQFAGSESSGHSELLLPTGDTHSTRHNASVTPNTRF